MPSLSSLPSPRDLPFIYKIDIQQGNVIDQNMLAQLRAGMDKKKVLFIMGSPIIQDTFHADRWDYVYTNEPGGGQPERRQITLYFEDDKLARIGGDVKPAESPLVATLHQDTTIKVPQLRKKGFVEKVKDKIPFVEPTPEEVVEVDVDEAAAEHAGEDTEPEENVNLPTLAEDTPPPRSPYADLQAAPGEGVIVPPDAPTNRKKKGFFARIADSIGIGADDEEIGDEDDDYDPGDPKYRDITDQSNL
ncbi:MAG: outer membrane protein assembly factor BamE [Gammaproteobacteria bacterium]|nr:outer membrane protein assembly factor BamE [Gammaproteobacteria bacterium]